jgi:acyl-CoA thioesterase II
VTAVGDIERQTAVTREDDGRYSAMVHRDWEIWGPCGGYVAAIALRAAGAESPFARPASFFCHYLSVAAFAPVDLAVTPLRSGRTVLAQRIEMSQDGRPVLDAMVWSVGPVDGLEHQDVSPPEVADPDDLAPPPPEPPLRPGEERPRYAFWDNFEQRPTDWVQPWPPEEPLPPLWRTWVRYVDGPADGPATGAGAGAGAENPWVGAARALVVLDVGSWPAGSRPHAYRNHSFIAPSLDLYAAFQDLGPASGREWLLLDAHSPVAEAGLLSWTGRVWSRDRRLVVSGGGQAVFRRTER